MPTAKKQEQGNENNSDLLHNPPFISGAYLPPPRIISMNIVTGSTHQPDEPKFVTIL
jgi:hypothetical protein